MVVGMVLLSVENFRSAGVGGGEIFEERVGSTPKNVSISLETFRKNNRLNSLLCIDNMDHRPRRRPHLCRTRLSSKNNAPSHLATMTAHCIRKAAHHHRSLSKKFQFHPIQSAPIRVFI